VLEITQNMGRISGHDRASAFGPPGVAWGSRSVGSKPVRAWACACEAQTRGTHACEAKAKGDHATVIVVHDLVIEMP